jgi:hypothetical protein
MNKLPRRILGPKRNEVTVGWIKLRVHNKEVHDLYTSPSIIRIIKSKSMRWEGHVARMEEKGNVYRLLARKLEGKRRLGRPRPKWADVIKMDLAERGLDGVGCNGM